MRTLLIALSVWLGANLPSVSAAEPTVDLAIANGRVSIVAKDASLSDILASWARAGGTTIVNADKIKSPAITLELNDVPEQQALEILLRSASGFLAVPAAASAPNQSVFARIVIMATRASARASVSQLMSSAVALDPPPPSPEELANAQLIVRSMNGNGQPIPDDQADAPPPGVVAAPPGFSRGDPPTPSAPRTSPTSTSPAPSAPAFLTAPAPGVIIAPQPQQQTRSPQR